MIDEVEAQKLRVTLTTSGWHEVMRPRLANRARQATKALVLSAAERSREFAGTDYDTDDNVLRAIIRDCEWMTVCWNNELSVFDQNRRTDELLRQDVSLAGANR